MKGVFLSFFFFFLIKDSYYKIFGDYIGVRV